jgi:mono/diheme cytochrome c family protein
MLQQVYDSAWHLPAVTFLSITVFFIALARRQSFIVGFTILCAWSIVLDACVNGALSPIPEKLRSPFELAFVVLGDWRYFILLERYWKGSLTPAGALRSLALTSIVPLLSLGFMQTAAGHDMRAVFLVYEAVFFVLALVVQFIALPRLLDTKGQTFLRAITRFELLQYGLWAIADLLLITGQSWAMTLRLTANILYYVLFVPFVWWRSPDSPGQRRSLIPAAALSAAAFALSFAALASGKHVDSSTPAAPSADLSFIEAGKRHSTLSLTRMVQSLPVTEISAFDPYYQHNKRWRALSIENALRSGFDREPTDLAGEEFVLRASDGFAAYFPGKRLLEGGAYIAIADLDVPDWEPIGARKDNPGPFYLVWARPDQQDLETHARPWQLASIEIVSFDSQFPHVRPEHAVEGSPAERGFQTFRVQCLPCHSINRAGGNVGPELNVPRNILEYRDTGTVRAFIKNPLSFRYTVMPAHPNMTPDELDGLMAYFTLMKNQKHDKDAAASASR